MVVTVASPGLRSEALIAYPGKCGTAYPEADPQRLVDRDGVVEGADLVSTARRSSRSCTRQGRTGRRRISPANTGPGRQAGTTLASVANSSSLTSGPR